MGAEVLAADQLKARLLRTQLCPSLRRRVDAGLDGAHTSMIRHTKVAEAAKTIAGYRWRLRGGCSVRAAVSCEPSMRRSM